MKIYISTGSATYAQKANRLLSTLNIKSKIVQRQKTGLNGCGYGVEVTHDDLCKITKLLSDAGVKILDVRSEE